MTDRQHEPNAPRRRRLLISRVPSAPWMLSLSVMWFGWGASTTTFGIVVLGTGTAWLIALYLAERTPSRLARFTLVLSLGWVPAFVWSPWLLLVPLALLALAAWQAHRRRARVRAAVEAFEQRYEGRPDELP